MNHKNSTNPSSSPYSLQVERLGPLPLINHFLKQLKLEKLLDDFIPTKHYRTTLSYTKGLGILLRSILIERDPIYRQYETVSSFSPTAFGLSSQNAENISDDRIGRALDRLFDADRGTLLTEIVFQVMRGFQIDMKEFHNDSTSIRLTGQYRRAQGRSIRGQQAPWITYGHSKDHRPDLKQLIFLLTVTDDGGVPVQFRCENGNTSDSRTHIETWETLQQITGTTDFLYIADSKLCSRENMDTIDRKGGRWITVLPRNRLEDRIFREWIQTNEPEWEDVWDRPHPRHTDGVRDVWKVFRDRLPSQEGWPVIWVFSSLLASHRQRSRQERLARTLQELGLLQKRLEGPRPRRRSKEEVRQEAEELLDRWKVKAYIYVKIGVHEDIGYRQERRGRPGPNVRYRRISHKRLRLMWEVDEDKIAFDRRSDGMYPLLTNDRSLSPREIFEAHKRQPLIERRFQQMKSVYEVAPVFLKNEGRIEALFFMYYLALLVQALIERQLRKGMKREGIEEIPLYPEDRMCRNPTAEQVFRLFSLPQRSQLFLNKIHVQTFEPELTEFQLQVLKLLDIPADVYLSQKTLS